MQSKRSYDGDARTLARRINGYFRELEEKGGRGGPSDLLAAMQLDMDTARWLSGQWDGPYAAHGRLLRQAAVRLRAHLETAQAWAGSNGSKSVFLIKQPLWDGAAYADRREPEAAAVTVRFGRGEEKDAFD